MAGHGGGFISISRARLVELLAEHTREGSWCACGLDLHDYDEAGVWSEHVADVLTSPRVPE